MTVQVDRDMERAFSQLYEIQKRLLNGSLSPTMARRPLQQIIEGNLGDNGASGLFVSPEQQVENLRRWNDQYGWGFTEEDFESLPDAPDSPGGLIAVVLVPYLGTGTVRSSSIDISEIGGVQRTFDALWQVAGSQQPNAWRWDGMKSDKEHLRLLEGIEHPTGLRWEVIDLGANRGTASADVRTADDSPHAGILAAAAHHPQWVQAMDGDKVPYVDLPGYQVTVDGDEPWRYVPYLGWARIYRGVGLGARWDDYRRPSDGVPVIRECRN